MTDGRPEYHVTPIGDLILHDEDEDCICGPDVQVEDGSNVVVHYSLDRRETEGG